MEQRNPKVATNRKPARPRRVLAVVPAYNEEKSILKVVQRTRRAVKGVDVLVIDDQSTDRTRMLLIEQQIDHISLPLNLGIGGAVQTGFLMAHQDGYDVVVQVDGDGQHPPEQIPLLLAAMSEHGADAVIGSRYLQENQIVSTRARRYGGGLLGLLIRLTTGKTITDPTSGFRAYNARAVAFLCDSYPQEYPEPISAIELLLNGFQVVETPVRMEERQHGTSSITGWNTVFYMIKVMFAILVVRLRRRSRS